MVGQLISNRRSNRHQKIRRRQAEGSPLELHSKLGGRKVRVKLYGVHLLQFSGTDPADSEFIWWDGKLISEETLIKLLRIDIDPDDFSEVDPRNHHKQPPELPFEWSAA